VHIASESESIAEENDSVFSVDLPLLGTPGRHGARHAASFGGPAGACRDNRASVQGSPLADSRARSPNREPAQCGPAPGLLSQSWTAPWEQSHRELGAIAQLAVDRDGAAVLLRYDFVADLQPKPRALAGRLQSIFFFGGMPTRLSPHIRTSTPDSRVVTFKAARNNRAYEFSSGELAEKAPRGKKINSFKAFGEPVVNLFQQLDGLPLAALIGP
jgi:hypothetical protein